MTIVYPGGDITPHGWWHVVNDTRPTMRLRAYDGSIDFYLMGGYAPPFHDDTTSPESVVLKDLKGLVPPWKHITQKGATQDGITHIDALYDPTEVEMTLECVGRDQKHLRRVVSDVIASIDAKKQSELSFLTQELGYWWAPIRWFQGNPPDPLSNMGRNRQQLSLRLSSDDAFWRSYDDVAVWQFTYETMMDTFGVDYSSAHNLGPNWPQYYWNGTGGGWCTSDGKDAMWVDGTPYEGREVVNGPYKNFSTTTNNQVVSIVLGNCAEITFPDNAWEDIWARMGRNPDGTWDGSGVRLRFGVGSIHLSYFSGFVETVMREHPIIIPPVYGEKWTLVCGYEGNERTFKVLRGLTAPLGLEVLSHTESGNSSPLGASNRGVGFGMRAAAPLIQFSIFGHPIATQATPAHIRKISASDNSTVSQSGYLTCTNVGDQPMYRDHVLFGPGMFRIYDGPGSTEYIKFGPLLPNQVVFLRTDPRSKTPLVQDLTTLPPTQQELNIFQQAVDGIINLFGDNNAFTDQIESMFGIRPPQGPMYSLLDGRFSDNSAIPAKSPGRPAEIYSVRVEVDDGNADTKIISSGTPLRRWPL